MTMILCIEDDANLLEDLVDELKEAGYQTLQATNGREGLEIISRQPPELVISDISMPDMNGYELLKAVREKNKKLAQMPFIFLSALAERDERIAGLNAGADEYLTKPIDFDFLLSKVNSIIRMRERMRKDHEEDTAKLLEHHQALYLEQRLAAEGLPKHVNDDDIVFE